MTTLKNKILTSFPTNKLRKNAKKKIQQLLSVADSLILKTQSTGMDDCFYYNEPKEVDQAFFWEWYEKEYKELVIRLEMDNDGMVTKAVFSDCMYHFSDDIILTFNSAPEQPEQTQLAVVPAKPRFTFEQVTEALKNSYISPLNNDIQILPKEENVNSRKVVSLGDYQERIDNKKERYENRAEKAQQQSNAFYQRSKEMADLIPFGQPILVGHHSEKRARNHHKKIWDDMGRSVKAQEKADYLETKAQNIGSAGIASDDANAIEKLKDKLSGLESAQERMKAINKIIRSSHMSETDKIEYMVESHKLSEKKAKELLAGDFAGRIGFASYQLSNNNAVIRQTRERIDELEKLHNQEPLSGQGEIEGLKWSLYEEDGRIKFSFDDIPNEELRRTLKSNGFKWSRYSKAWVRKLTANAVISTERLLEKHFN